VRHVHYVHHAPRLQERRTARRPTNHRQRGQRRRNDGYAHHPSHPQAARCAWPNGAQACHSRYDWDSSAPCGRLGRHSRRAGCVGVHFARYGVGARRPSRRGRNAPAASPRSGLPATRSPQRDRAANGAARLRLRRYRENRANTASATGLSDHLHAHSSDRMGDHDHRIGWISATEEMAAPIRHRHSDPHANCVCRRSVWTSDRTARFVHHSHRSAGSVTSDPAGRVSRRHPSRCFPCLATPRVVSSLLSSAISRLRPVHQPRFSRGGDPLAHSDSAPPQASVPQIITLRIP